MSIFKTDYDGYKKFKSETREFVLTKCEAMAEKIEESGQIPLRELINMLKEKRLLGLTAPEEYGGMGLSYSEYWPILADVAMTHHSIRLIVHAANGGWRLFHGVAPEAMKKEYIPSFVTGEKFLALAITEPETGTGRDISTVAERNGESYVINGKKHLISFSDFATIFVVLAVTDKGTKKEGLTTFLIRPGTPGFMNSPMPDTMGLKGSIHGTLTFKNCTVPADAVLGGVGQGLQIVLNMLELSRVSIATCCLGIAKRCMGLSLEFSKKRMTFGKYIATRQAVQGMLADMAMGIHALKLLITDAGEKFDKGKSITRESSMCKAFGIDVVTQVTDNALMIHGGIGYTNAFPIERLYRDARAMWFEEGTPTIQRLIIARDLLSEGLGEI